MAVASTDGRAMNRRSSIAAATILGIIAVLVFIIQPGYVQGLVDLGRLTGAEAGYVASAEMVGYAATMILMTALSHRMPWRPMLVGFIVLQAAGNLASMFHQSVDWLLITRFFAGLGAGGLSSLSFTAIGMTRNPDRQFGFLIMWILVYGAVGLFGLPSLFGAVGLHGFYLLVALLTLTGFAFVRLLPIRGGGHFEPTPDAVTISASGRLLAALSIFIFFLGCGILWAYVSLIGDARGLHSQEVASALSLSQFTGVAGALVAGVIGPRFGRAAPLILALILSALSCASIDAVGANAALLFGIVVCTFNFAWNLAQPIYLSSATGFDRDGRLVTQMVASQSCGLALGPFVGAIVGGNSPGGSLIWLVTALFVLSASLIVIPFLEAAKLRRGVYPHARVKA